MINHESRGPDMRIIIADDHPVVLLGLRKVIQGWGMTVVAEAGSPMAVAKAVVDHEFDVAIVDFNMPRADERDGAGLISDLVALKEGVRVVTYTLDARPSQVRLAIKAGARAVVAKSSGFEVLGLAIRTAFAGGSLIPRQPRTGSVPCVRPPVLSSREQLIVDLLAGGHSVNEIAEMLHRTPSAIRKARVSAMRKIDAAGAFLSSNVQADS